MASPIQTVRVSKGALWAGRALTALPVLMLLLSGVMKILKLPAVVQGFAKYGYPESQMVVIGLLEVGCTIVYLVPRLSVLGAVLMTAYLGGATASNVRIGDPSFIMTVLLGMMVWGGLFFRDKRIRDLIPLRK